MTAVWLERVSAAQQSDNRRNGEENDCNEEDELGDFDRRTGNSTEAEESRDKCDNEKSDCPAEHGATSQNDKSAGADDNRTTPSGTVEFREKDSFTRFVG
jgi:hypothetical protein